MSMTGGRRVTRVTGRGDQGSRDRRRRIKEEEKKEEKKENRKIVVGQDGI